MHLYNDSAFYMILLNHLIIDVHEISLNCGGSYIDSPKWIKNKNTTLNPKNKNVLCFQYAATIALNHKKTWKKSAKNNKY